MGTETGLGLWMLGGKGGLAKALALPGSWVLSVQGSAVWAWKRWSAGNTRLVQTLTDVIK